MNELSVKTTIEHDMFSPQFPEETARGRHAPAILIPAQLMVLGLGATGVMFGGPLYRGAMPTYSMLQIERYAETSQVNEVLNIALQKARAQLRAQQLQTERNSKAIELLSSWLGSGKEFDVEQRETVEFLKTALDEDRPSLRKLFQ